MSGSNPIILRSVRWKQGMFSTPFPTGPLMSLWPLALRCFSVLCRWFCHLWTWGLLSMNKNSGSLTASPAPQHPLPSVIPHRRPEPIHFPPQCWWLCSRQVSGFGYRGYRGWVKLSLISPNGYWHGLWFTHQNIRNSNHSIPLRTSTLPCLYFVLCLSLAIDSYKG